MRWRGPSPARRQRTVAQTPARKAMDAALKSVVVPVLREIGFRGSFPHFRRIRDAQIDLLGFQYNKYGGSFVVEVAKWPAQGFESGWKTSVAPEKATVIDTRTRLRLGSAWPSKGASDHWFEFGPRNLESTPDSLELPRHYAAIAHQVVERIKEQGERWWRDPATGDLVGPEWPPPIRPRTNSA